MTASLGSHLTHLIARRFCRFNIIKCIRTTARHQNETNRNANHPGVDENLPLVCVDEVAALLKKPILHSNLAIENTNQLPKQMSTGPLVPN